MPEKNKCDEKNRQSDEENAEEKKDVWSEDQKNRRYYYDDSHGYEVYDPEKDEEEN